LVNIIKFKKGSLIVRGETGTPYGQWDPRINAFRALPIYYPEILGYFKRSHMHFRDEAADPLAVSKLNSKIKLRSVLPTGAGKTFIALKAIEELNVATLVVVPTLDLMDQWRLLLDDQFDIDIGVYGGGENKLKPLTVSTYDSAYIRAEELGNKFIFIIFDEVHHLPAPSYSQIGELYIAPYRMGLTATFEREDGLHLELPRLVGGLGNIWRHITTRKFL
jgi:superfamily II DNA or RNA helicase